MIDLAKKQKITKFILSIRSEVNADRTRKAAEERKARNKKNRERHMDEQMVEQMMDKLSSDTRAHISINATAAVDSLNRLTITMQEFEDAMKDMKAINPNSRWFGLGNTFSA